MNNRTQWLRGSLAVAFVAVASLLVGCSKGSGTKAEVTGTVVYKGTPVGSGTIGFYDEKKQQIGLAQLKPDGGFIATDLPFGKAIVTVSSKSISTPVEKAPKGTPVIEGGAGKGVDLPAKYGDPGTSGLSVEIKENKQKLGEIKLD